ncbi:hypothetical protein [Massilia horti]|uniref:Uncharacterized protein n=1 Tax=Massilia horti TaxID=2562153 RepID=A0A4Y9SVR0_9BURK|nr:hypothetical protein [Massilia horti]TFW30800.1 hypothetical protein E4O92_15825 [Massilia horti]
MHNLSNAGNRIKNTFFTEGYFHIDLFDGMRITAPIKDNAQSAGCSRLVETGPSNHWDETMSLDHLIGQHPA